MTRAPDQPQNDEPRYPYRELFLEPLPQAEEPVEEGEES
jgi:hypothetical protein